jgi:pyruvate kinase
MSRTGIVCTIGPATNSPEAILRLKDAGMTVARLNGSHNRLEWHAETIALIREVVPDVPILLDIPGRKIRTTDLKHEPTFQLGDTIVLTTETGHDGTEKVPVNYSALHEDIAAGNAILADDGTLRFVVERVEGRDIYCRAECSGQLKSRKGINVPFVKLRTELVTERDRAMMRFACEHKVDFVGISFVESAEHVEAIRALSEHRWPRIIAKVENQGGLDNVDAVVAAADAIMIDRGDLSVETNLEQVALNQKRILDSARSHGKPVIVATEMLHTMIENPFPTKAEVSDITNAVLDGCAATMLSGETAVGNFPADAVATMRCVADTSMAYQQAKLDAAGTPSRTVPQAMEDAIALICRELPITKIVAVTISGYAARMIAARQPRQPIIGVSNDVMSARAMNLLSGVEGVFVDVPFRRTSTDHITDCLEALYRTGRLERDDLILVTAVGYPKSGNRMNLIQTHQIADLAATLGWDEAPPKAAGDTAA